MDSSEETKCEIEIQGDTGSEFVEIQLMDPVHPAIKRALGYDEVDTLLVLVITHGGIDVLDDDSTFLDLEIEPGARFSVTKKVFRIEMDGHWVGQAESEGFTYNVRLTAMEGEAGEVLWLGTDRPFMSNRDDVTGRVDSMVRLPADQRPSSGGLQKTAQQHRQERSVGGEPGDQIMMGGQMQWYLEAAADHYVDFLQAHETERTQKAIEHLTGFYSPSTRRLLLVGTHCANTNAALIGPDSYDLILAPDGKSAYGHTSGHSGNWKNQLQLDCEIELKEDYERVGEDME